MGSFEAGTVLQSIHGVPITIESYIGGGGQGDVYKVIYEGQPKALKWYKTSFLKDMDAFRENLKKNIERGAPDAAFIWPQALTEIVDGSFGYVMDLIPEGYKEFTKILVSPTKDGFPSFKHSVNVCLKLAKAFRILHNNGYSYQDLNAGNFFIHPKKADVLICDNDNVAPNGTNTGIIGTPPYIAPEILTKESKPNTHSDEFSLAVVIFMLLFTSHPLEGRRWSVPCLTPTIEKVLYGTDPLFIMDPEDDNNRPIEQVHDNVINIWDYLPQYIKDIFIKAFSKESLRGIYVNGQKDYPRVKEFEWIKALIRFQNEIVRCPKCRQNDIFIQNSTDTKCDGCGNLYQVSRKFEFSDYTMIAAKNTIIYRSQLGATNATDALKRVALVVEKEDGSGVLGLKNISDFSFIATAPSGKTKQIEPGRVIPLIPNMVIQIRNSTVTIR